jgi:hypothetical protein
MEVLSLCTRVKADFESFGWILAFAKTKADSKALLKAP